MIKKLGVGALISVLGIIKFLWEQIIHVRKWSNEKKRKQVYKKVDKDVKDGNIEELNRIHRG